MAVKKINTVCQRYSDFSNGYDLATRALHRQGNAKEFGFLVVKSGDYLPANVQDADKYHHAANRTYANPQNTAYSENWEHQPRNQNARRNPDVPRPAPSMRDDDPRMQYTARTKPKPY